MIGIIGYGRFGRLTARYLARDFAVVVQKRPTTDTSAAGANIIFGTLEAVCRQEIVILAVPISALRATLQEISPHLSDDTLVVDVASVKEYPVQWMKELLPPAVSILATHPMFGPDSAATSLQDRKIVVSPARLEAGRFEKIVAYLKSKGLIVIETTPSEHDRQIAVTLALTHFIGRSLSEFGAGDLPIDTEGYKRLRHILGVVEHDTWQLFTDMHRYNPFADEVRRNFRQAMAATEEKLLRTPLAN